MSGAVVVVRWRYRLDLMTPHNAIGKQDVWSVGGEGGEGRGYWLIVTAASSAEISELH